MEYIIFDLYYFLLLFQNNEIFTLNFRVKKNN